MASHTVLPLTGKIWECEQGPRSLALQLDDRRNLEERHQGLEERR